MPIPELLTSPRTLPKRIRTDEVMAAMPSTMRNDDIERLMRINSVALIVLSKYVVRKMMADGQLDCD